MKKKMQVHLAIKIEDAAQIKNLFVEFKDGKWVIPAWVDFMMDNSK